ncbi:MAG: outer membrane protein transport protein [candidate division Zixibacteria bacterium]|nr:outer membrane protein transport protein [candidate division Zixibacteria bacterium]
MRIVRLAVAVLLLLSFGSSELYATGFESTGLGTTARGMGGAFRAVADDWSAAYYNPAGYAFITDNQLGTSLGLIHYRHEIIPDFVATDDYGNDYGWGIANGQEIYNFHRILNNPSAGFVARLPLWGETVLGLSAYQPFDNSLRWRLYDPSASFMRAYNEPAIGSIEIPGHDYLIDLDVVAFQLTAAKEFNDEKIAVGIGLQLLRGDLWFSHLTFRQNPRGDDNPFVDDRPRDRIPEFTDHQGMGWGFGLRAGILWKLTEKIDIAVTAYLPFDITISGTTDYTFVLPRSKVLEGTVEAGSADYLFVMGDILHLASDFETKLQLPSSFGFGLAFHPNEKLTISMDAEYTMWSEYEGLQFTQTNFTNVPVYEQEFFTTNLSNPVEWDNAGKVALGLRYKLWPNLTLLGGGSADQSPMRNSIEYTPQFMELGTKRSYNAGAILHINQWDIGLITSYYSYLDINVGVLTDIDDDNMFDNFPGAYKASTYETVLSLSYRF